MRVQYQDLAQLSLFSCFSKEELQIICESYPCSLRTYAKDQMIYLPGESCNTLDVLLSGSVSIQSLDEEGKVFKVQVMEEGDTYGATLLFGKRNEFPMAVVADGPSQVLHLSKALVLQLCKASSQFTSNLLGVISDKAHALSTTLTNLSSRSLRENLLSYLKGEALRQKGPTIILGITKKELAHRLGVQRTSLSRVLATLREEGAITFDRNRITLL